MNIALFVPCFVNVMSPNVAECTRQILRRQECTVDVPLDQTCCGQPAFNTGYWDDAAPVAEHYLDVFESYDHIVSPSGSCVTMVRHFYERLFPEGHPRAGQARIVASKTFELCEFLVDILKIEDVNASFDATVSYHDACHALRELHVKEQPRRLLRNVAGLTLVEIENAETCCGFGGTFSTKHEPVSTSMGREKLDGAIEGRADYLVTTDSSCLLHLGGLAEAQKKPIRCLHIAEILASRETTS